MPKLCPVSIYPMYAGSPKPTLEQSSTFIVEQVGITYSESAHTSPLLKYQAQIRYS